MRWVRLAKAEDSVIIGSQKGMAIHFKADQDELRALGRATRGVKSMRLRSGDALISMDILPSQVVANIAVGSEDEPDEDLGGDTDAILEESDNPGPWLLGVTMKGFGKRVPIGQFRLQHRAGLGVKAIRFKSKDDQLVALHVVNADDELMIVTNRGIIIRQSVNDISPQSRSATGVRVQRLDADDAIAAVALVPPSGEEELAEMSESEES